MMEGGKAGATAESGHRDYLRAIFEAFADMPHRGSGTWYEARAARILSRIASHRIAAHRSASTTLRGRVDLEPFAVDISSGAWNVALHGTLLCSILALLWLGGLGVGFAYGPGEGAATTDPWGRSTFP